MVNRLLKLILTFENILGFIRNYLFLVKKVQRFFVIRTILEVVLIFLNFRYYGVFRDISWSSNSFYYLFTNFYSLIMFFLQITHFKNFKKLIKSLNLSMSYFPVAYNKQKKLILFFVAFNLIVFFVDLTFYYITFDIIIASVTSTYWFFLFEITLYIGYLRFLNGFSVIYCFLSLKTDQICCIIRSVNEELKLRDQPVEDGGISSTLQAKLQLIDKWSAAYATIAKISKLYNKMFGVQVALMFLFIIIYCTSMLYAVTLLGVKGDLTPNVQLVYTITVMEYLIALCFLSWVGQSADNSAELLKQRLSLLLLRSFECNKLCKATRDLLRQISTYPIQMKAFGSIAVNMSLMPTCIGLCTSYTVIMLQFNNVI